MKLIAYSLLALTLSISAHAQLEIMPDVFTDPSSERLSEAEIKAEKKTFLDFLTKYRNSEFVGDTQYILSSLNLSLRAHAKYSIELDGTILFQLATAGNQHMHVSDVTFPMQGSIYFEIKNKQGQPIAFETEDNEVIHFSGKKNTFYIVESEKAFNLRKTVQSKFNRADKPIGRFLAISTYDLFTQDIEFYEIQDSKKLLRRGSFNGNAMPARRR